MDAFIEGQQCCFCGVTAQTLRGQFGQTFDAQVYCQSAFGPKAQSNVIFMNSFNEL